MAGQNPAYQLCNAREFMLQPFLFAASPPRQQDEDTVLHVSNLTRNVTEAHLQEIFSTYGRIVAVDIGECRQNATRPLAPSLTGSAACDAAVDEKVGLPRGWARIEYAAGRDAEVAQHLMDGVS